MERRKEVQGFGLYRASRRPGCAVLYPREKGEQGPVGPSAVSMGSQGHGPPFRLRTGGGQSVGPKQNFDRRKLSEGMI